MKNWLREEWAHALMRISVWAHERSHLALYPRGTRVGDAYVIGYSYAADAYKLSDGMKITVNGLDRQKELER